MKKSVFALFALFFVAFLAGCDKKEKNITLLMAEINPPESIVGLMDQRFADEVAILSGGTLKIDLRCTGILGDHKEVLADIFSDNPSINIVRCSISDFADKGCAKSRLLSIPYTFTSREHFWAFANSEYASEIFNEPQALDYPIRGLFFGEEGFRHFFSIKEIKEPKDFVGRKVRVSSDPVMRSMVSELGGSPDATIFSEVYAALRLGKIDVAEQPIADYKTNYFYEVAPYLILDGHTLGIAITVITDKTWNSLSEKHRECLIQAGKIASEYCEKISIAREETSLKELEDLGAHITLVKDVQQWQKAVKNTAEKNTTIDVDFYKKVLELEK